MTASLAKDVICNSQNARIVENNGVWNWREALRRLPWRNRPLSCHRRSDALHITHVQERTTTNKNTLSNLP